MAATEILNYARLVEQAVDKLRRKGCSEDQLSFENDTLLNSGITYIGRIINSQSPVDKSCHVFHDNGGKIEYLKVQEKYLNPELVQPGREELGNGFYFFLSKKLEIAGNNYRREIVMVATALSIEVCNAINDILKRTYNSSLWGSFNQVFVVGGQYFPFAITSDDAGSGIEYNIGSGWEPVPYPSYCGRHGLAVAPGMAGAAFFYVVLER